VENGAIKSETDGPRSIRTESLVPYINCRPDCDFQSGFNFVFPNGKTVENGAIKSETDEPRPSVRRVSFPTSIVGRIAIFNPALDLLRFVIWNICNWRKGGCWNFISMIGYQFRSLHKWGSRWQIFKQIAIPYYAGTGWFACDDQPPVIARPLPGRYCFGTTQWIGKGRGNLKYLQTNEKGGWWNFISVIGYQFRSLHKRGSQWQIFKQIAIPFHAGTYCCVRNGINVSGRLAIYTVRWVKSIWRQPTLAQIKRGFAVLTSICAFQNRKTS